MTLAVMQPYFFPYLGYWQLIASSDEFVFFDVVQYNKKSWMNRNRILHLNENKGFQYITLPVTKHAHGSLIKDILINNDLKWKEEILGKLTIYRNLNAPYYQEVKDLIERIFSLDHKRLIDMSISSTEAVLGYLELKFKYKLASEINFDKRLINEADDWALSICKHLGYRKYINPYGGFEIFDEEKYKENNVNIVFLKPDPIIYNQSSQDEFQPNLSIIDLMMFNDKHKVRDWILNGYKLYDKNELSHLS